MLHCLCIMVLHKKDWQEEEILEASCSTAHRGEGCRSTKDAEPHRAGRQCLAASFHALVPRVQPVAAVSASKSSMVLPCLFPPAFSISWSFIKKVRSAPAWDTGKLMLKMWGEKQDNVFSLENIVCNRSQRGVYCKSREEFY